MLHCYGAGQKLEGSIISVSRGLLTTLLPPGSRPRLPVWVPPSRWCLPMFLSSSSRLGHQAVPTPVSEPLSGVVVYYVGHASGPTA